MIKCKIVVMRPENSVQRAVGLEVDGLAPQWLKLSADLDSVLSCAEHDPQKPLSPEGANPRSNLQPLNPEV